MKFSIATKCIVLKLALLAALVPASAFAFMREGVPERCREMWSKGSNFSTHRHMVFRQGDVFVSDPNATLSAVEGLDCVDGYYIDRLEIISKKKISDTQVIENHVLCRTGFRHYTPVDDFQSYLELRDALNGDNPPGLFEIIADGEECTIRPWKDEKDYKRHYKEFVCTAGRPGSVAMTSCRHARHIHGR